MRRILRSCETKSRSWRVLGTSGWRVEGDERTGTRRSDAIREHHHQYLFQSLRSTARSLSESSDRDADVKW